ncbi:MAG: dipeptidyl-peptidase-4 [Planctomycetota bacterium]|jgi:dipeptidyl-peptidase-4
MKRVSFTTFVVSFFLALIALSGSALAQRSFGRRAAGPGSISQVQWSDDGKSFSFTKESKQYRFDLGTLKMAEVNDTIDRRKSNSQPNRRLAGGASTGKYVGRPSRGRQYTQVDSPDEQWEAHFKNWNVVLINKSSGKETPVTTDGDEIIHAGTASWVYGEELNQNTAMWWTPDSKKILYYKFDDTGVERFHLVRGWSKVNTTHYPEYYPKAGAKNPAAELWVYDLASKKNTRIDAGGGPEEYLYAIRAAKSGQMLVNWTDRLQQHLKVLAIDVETGKCRVVVEERQDTWQENAPRMRFMTDNHRYIWPTEKSGNTHFELRDLSGKLHNTITQGEFQTSGIQFVDEEAKLVGFTAFSSNANPYFAQYHVVGLDGKNQRRVTTLDHHHSRFNLSPDKKWLIARYEETNLPPCTALYSTKGKLVAKLAESDPKGAANIAEMFKFRSDDDKFDIYGVLYKPADFDPKKSYPIINALYGGPGSREISASYISRPRRENNRGYLIVKVNNRGTGGRSKAFLGAAYLRLGDVDIQDHADAIRMLRKRPYVDGKRVGIVGSSYGGYMSAMGILKHPDVYTASVNLSGVTDWRNYDTIYTERYMSTPQLNKKGYDIGRAMNRDYIKEFKRLKRHLLIMHGMVDDNVHPNNAFQLIDALDKMQAKYESRFFPNNGHGLGRGASTSQWEFFDRVLKPNSL